MLSAAVVYMAAAVDHYADTLLRRLEAADEHGAAPVTAWSLVVDAEELVDDVYLLHRAALDLEQTRGSASEVLNALYRRAYRHNADQVLYKLFLAAALPYLQMVWDWVFSASSVRDGCGEFFGSVLGRAVDGPEALVNLESPDTGSRAGNGGGDGPVAAFPSFLGESLVLRVLRAGRARTLLTAVDPGNVLLQVQAPTFADCVRGAHLPRDEFHALVEKMSVFCAEVEGVAAACAEKVGDESTASTEMKATASKAAKCALDQEATINNGLDAPHKDMQLGVCVAATGEFPAAAFDLPVGKNGVSGKSAVCSIRPGVVRAFWSGASGQRVIARPVCGEFELGWPPLSQLVEMLVVTPVERVDVLVQQVVFHYFVEKIALHDHLAALWRYVLLGAGDFADVLVERIELASSQTDADELYFTRPESFSDSAAFARLKDGHSDVLLRQRMHLAECLHSALITCGADSDPLAKRISISVKDQLHDPETNTDGAESLSVPSLPLWESDMLVSYNAGFPLNFIISSDLMGRYSLFFGFFLRVRRAEHCLRRLFMTCRRQSSLQAHSTHAERALLDDSHLCTRIWRFCWEAEHFVRIVGEYEATQVVGSSWTALQARWKKMDGRGRSGGDIWSLRAAIDEFVEESTRRALLGERHAKVMKVIYGALEVIVRLERLLLPAIDPTRKYSRDEVLEFLHKVNESADSLQKRTKFLVVVLQQLVAIGAGSSQPHLADLLTRLNYNNFY